MRGLAVERLIIATMSLGAAERALDDTIAYAVSYTHLTLPTSDLV